MKDTLTIAPLLIYLNTIQPLSKELEAKLAESFYPKKIEKGSLLLKEGAVCTNLWFLSNGLLRSFHSIEDKEFTSRIMFTGHIVISPGSFFTQTPATESIEALADCEVLVLSHSRLQEVYKQFPEFNYHSRIITEQYFFKQEQRLYMLRKPEAIARYKYFMENYADFLQQIPQKHIASFLGIARETLSRIRNKIRK